MSSADAVRLPSTIGVLGAGQMGAGIAQLATQTGARTLLYDPDPAARERGRSQIAAGLDRLTAKGRLDAEERDAALARVVAISEIAELAPCGLVIEAAPERLDLKRDLLQQVAAAVAPDAVIATNTSSLSITEIAVSIPGPERVVGLHFFNPAPVMRLVEVVAGLATAAPALAVARAVGEAMGKHVIDATDIAGFLVNRVNRPFFLEALRVLQERIATVEQIDRIMRLGGGFRMGPFELMDLIGIETNHAVAESFLRQTYGEPRYRPSPIAAQLIAAGRLGRKTGVGWYAYPEGGGPPVREPDPPRPEGGGGDGRLVVVLGDTPVAADLRGAAEQAGFAIGDGGTQQDAWLVLDAGRRPGAGTGPRAVLVDGVSLHRCAPHAAGFGAFGPLADAGLVEVTRTPLTEPLAIERLQQFVHALGKCSEPVSDGPGLVLARIVACVINEGAFLIGEGGGSPDDVDTGLELGLNYPRGPIRWADLVGGARVLDLLDGLADERREERYRAAPRLRARVAIGARLAG
ncbi:3-hydroxyacyl-CoA dehydrogenase NAD-binding domain-containing protein [Paraconexibacter sp.]|uniref:3-hydroxyacyl-CoA dehydrogenase NAD-binding domain-containing protein n=1 Tax=Paraconexibacter sp. TaxID=2949640 RepID=UPI00356ADAB4